MSTSKSIFPDIQYPDGFTPKLGLGRYATSRYVRQHPIHRWFTLRHSYSPELIKAILEDWELPRPSTLLDPFVGAGTTILTGKQNGYSGIGIDLSPLSIVASQAKLTDYDLVLLKRQCSRNNFSGLDKDIDDIVYEWISSSDRLLKAFSINELKEFIRIRENILKLDSPYRTFFILALLAIIPKFSRAIADGGWFRWITREDQSSVIAESFFNQLQAMISDLENNSIHDSRNSTWRIILGDARDNNNLRSGSIDGVITSPPYPNRHDYSRVYQIELLLLGISEKEITQFRHSSLRSHVEASTPINRAECLKKFHEPDILADCLQRFDNQVDNRIPRMIKGYFEDMYLTLLTIKELLKPQSRAAFVVGNVKHFGNLVPVDEILISIGKQIELTHYKSWVVRLRGNSAQQMEKFGREPSRETIVMFQKT